MLKNCWAFAASWLLLCSCFSRFAEATVVPPGSPFVVDVWGIQDGLPQSSVISVAQTREGYLWLGTLNGLVRFDGVKFTLFDEANTTALPSSRIVHLFEDDSGNLWVGTENEGVVLMEKNGSARTFEFGRGAAGGRLVASTQDAHGVVWLVAANGAVGRYEGGELEVAPAGCKWIVAEQSGLLWLGTDSGLFGLEQEHAGSGVFVVQQQVPVSSRLDFLLASRNGGYWRLADGRIQKWRGAERERDFGVYPWGDTPVVTACEDLDGNLVVGTYGSGVYWFDAAGKYHHLSKELSHNSILAITVDREGNLWVGTNGGGLNRVKRRMFQVLPITEGLVVQSVAQDANGGLWIGYNGNRIDYWRDGKGQQFTLVQDADPKIRENSYVKSVFVDRHQQVWAGMQTPAGTGLFRLEQGKFQPVSAGVLNQTVSALYQDRHGVLWVGAAGGLVRWDGLEWRLYSARDGLPADEVRAICEDVQGDLWIGTSGGLARFRNGQFAAFRKQDGLASDDISSLLPDADGALWIGTRGSGLMRFKESAWTSYTTTHGLAGNSIGYLIKDGEGNLWLGSNAGLMRAPKTSLDEFARGERESIICRAYVEADGLPTRECTQGSQPAATRSADGTLWLPTAKGLVSIHPSKLKPNPFPPPVIIESVLIEGAEQGTGRIWPGLPDQIVVSPREEQLEIRYTSLNLGAAGRSQFKYRLAGHETAWNEVANTRVARYSKLPPGDYRFEVMAANEDGVWNTTPAAQVIIIQPPFWKTAWFMAVSILCLLGAVVLVVYYFSTQKLQRQLAILRQQEALERERARIARDLHDQLGANLTQVALLGELAQEDKHLPAEVDSHAQQITQTARETTKALDEIVWAVNPSNDTLEGLINYICKYAQEYFQIAGLKYRLDVPTQLPQASIPPDVRHNVFLAAKEAVNNVVKHAQATEAWLRLQLEPHRFTLEIQDNGRGLGPITDSPNGRNGLRNMRKRMEDIGGSFSIGAAAERGAVVRLSAPLKTI